MCVALCEREKPRGVDTASYPHQKPIKVLQVRKCWRAASDFGWKSEARKSNAAPDQWWEYVKIGGQLVVKNRCLADKDFGKRQIGDVHEYLQL
jgi:hypothetical protein